MLSDWADLADSVYAAQRLGTLRGAHCPCEVRLPIPAAAPANDAPGADCTG